MLSNSGPLTLIKFALDSFATAFASNVFPHPGGPHMSTPHAASMPTALNSSGLRIGCTIAMCSSSRVACSAPMSAHDTSGTVANPSRFDDGCTCFSARVKSGKVMQSGESWDSVSGSGCARRKCTMEFAGEEAERLRFEKGAGLEEGAGCGGASGVAAGGPSMAIDASPSESSCPATASGRTMLPSDSCWKIRLTAMMPAAPVSAAKSAPT